MSEVLEVLHGPVVGLIFVVFALAGIIVTAAFAALIAQMGLLLRMRTRESQPQPARTRSITYRKPAGAGRLGSYITNRKEKAAPDGSPGSLPPRQRNRGHSINRYVYAPCNTKKL